MAIGRPPTLPLYSQPVGQDGISLLLSWLAAAWSTEYTVTMICLGYVFYYYSDKYTTVVAPCHCWLWTGQIMILTKWPLTGLPLQSWLSHNLIDGRIIWIANSTWTEIYFEVQLLSLDSPDFSSQWKQVPQVPVNTTDLGQKTAKFIIYCNGHMNIRDSEL